MARLIDFPLWYVERERSRRSEAGTEMEDWKVGEEINWSQYVAVCYLGWRSRESELGLQMKPESELCEIAPASKDSGAKQTSQCYQITPSQPFAKKLTDTAAPPLLFNALLPFGEFTRTLHRCGSHFILAGHALHSYCHTQYKL